LRRALTLCALLGGIYLAGCGGGGGGNSLAGVGTKAATANATVLITDDFRADYLNIWATINQVAAVPQGGGAPVVLYSNTAGEAVDLETLHDSSGDLFSFLGSAGIPAGTYTGVQITIGPTMQLVPVGSTTAATYTVDSTIPKNSTGEPVLSMTFASPKTIKSTVNNVIIDFNLANFVIRGSQVIPAIQDGSVTGLTSVTNPARQKPVMDPGTVSALGGTAPDLTFTLTSASGTTQPVVTTASTAIYGASLANGSNVVVTGTVDTTTENLVATRINVLPSGVSLPGMGPASVQLAGGVASALNATAGTFTLTITQVCGFTPTTVSITVATSSTTILRGDNGATLTSAAFFTALATTPTVQVQGTFDSKTNTLTATGISIYNPANDGGWENSPHNFRPGTNAHTWGNGSFNPGGLNIPAP